MYHCMVGTKNPGRCREVAVIERWPLVEVRLYFCNFLSQCLREGWKDKLQEQKDEGCAVTGHLEVNKVCRELYATNVEGYYYSETSIKVKPP